MHPHPGPLPGPVIGPPLRVADVQERLPGEEAALRELHPGLDPPLVLRGADPRGIDSDAAGLRVLQPLPVPPRLQPVRRVHHRLHVVRDEQREHASEEPPGRLAARDHRQRRLRERQVDIAVAGEHRREHQRVQPPPPLPVGDHAEVAEVDLQLTARRRVVDPHRHPRPPRGVTALGRREPRQRPVGNRGPRPLQQLADLHQRQALPHPPGYLVLPGGQGLPRRAVPRRAGRADRPNHDADQLVGQPAFPAIAGKAGLLRGPDVPGRGLHVHPRTGRGRALAQPRQPRTQDFLHLCHQDLPERHPCHLSQNGTNRAILAGVVHQLATGVVPSPWQQPSAGGPMLMADDTASTLKRQDSVGTVREVADSFGMRVEEPLPGPLEFKNLLF